MAIPKVVAKVGFRKELNKGSYLLYQTLVESVKGEPKKGQLVHIIDNHGKFMAQGFYNPTGGIAVQIVSIHEKENINEEFFKEKILSANAFRTKQLGRVDAYRLFYGESDGIPGLLVDRFGPIASMQITCPGVEIYKPVMAKILLEIDGIKTVVERNDSRNRVKTGLPVLKGVIDGDKKTQTVIQEGRVQFEVDVIRGHKTGFYLDQFENRIQFEDYCFEGANVLDVFSYTGGFGLHALAKGAHVTFIDLPEALEQAKKNVKLNGWSDRATFLEGAGFDITKKLLSKVDRFDVISCDPPAFVQKADDLEKGKKAYHQINYNCFKLVKDGGILVSSSCSHFLTEHDFLDVLIAASANAGVMCELVERRYQARDHLTALASKGGNYLKCYFLRVNQK